MQARFVGLQDLRGQRGAVLVVALVILAAITVVGVSSFQSTSLQMKMVTSAVNRSQAFALAEAGVQQAAAWLQANVDDYDDLYSGAGALFSSTCEGGLCFFGEYTPDMVNTYECERGGSQSPWHYNNSLSVWRNANLHRTVTVNGVQVKYIVEFMCFVGRDPTLSFGPFPDASPDSDPLFRITAYIDASTGEAPVMLQVSQTVRL